MHCALVGIYQFGDHSEPDASFVGVRRGLAAPEPLELPPCLTGGASRRGSTLCWQAGQAGTNLIEPAPAGFVRGSAIRWGRTRRRGLPEGETAYAQQTCSEVRGRCGESELRPRPGTSSMLRSPRRQRDRRRQATTSIRPSGFTSVQLRRGVSCWRSAAAQ